MVFQSPPAIRACHSYVKDAFAVTVTVPVSVAASQAPRVVGLADMVTSSTVGVGVGVGVEVGSGAGVGVGVGVAPFGVPLTLFFELQSPYMLQALTPTVYCSPLARWVIV